MKRPRNDAPTPIEAALEALGGAALVLDAGLAVVAATAGARALLGTDVPLGVSAPRLLCGGAVNRPIAEALARGVAVSGTIERPTPQGSETLVRLRATPLEHGGRITGWLLLLGSEPAKEGPGAPVRFHGLWTQDDGMKQAFHIVDRAARREATVLLRGETGTGKELLARAVHELSPRRAGPFAAINCAAIAPSLLESELFGHVRGAFTGALRDHPGFFRSAHRGTLFLDEVAEMPLELQAKLLRVLETRAVVPVGGRESIPVDVRIVAATHQSLRLAVESGRFRADLMYRLRVVPIFVPPLRARPGDVALLAQKIVDELNLAEERRVTHISPAAMAALERHAWPGNVRELRNVLEYAYVVGEGSVLLPDELPPELRADAASGEEERAFVAARSEPPAVAPASARDQEVARIRRALERAAGHRERAAQMLGLSRVTLWRRMRELGIEA